MAMVSAPDVEDAFLDHLPEFRLSDLFLSPTLDHQVRDTESKIVVLGDRVADLEIRQKRLVALIETEEVRMQKTCLGRFRSGVLKSGKLRPR
jgi:hypothetical protein